MAAKNQNTNTEGQVNNGIKKSFLPSSLIGLLFGIIIVVSLYVLKEKLNKLVYLLPIYTGLLSGISGIVADFIDKKLFDFGIHSILARRIISFLLSMIFAVLITLVGLFIINNQSLDEILEKNFIWGIFLGLGIGLTVTLLDYFFWKKRKEILKLKLKNKYLKELAEKDKKLRKATKNMLIAEEKNKLAREIHDSISQGIHGILYSTQSLNYYLDKKSLNRHKLKEITSILADTAQLTLDEIKSLILELQPSLLAEKGLIKALTLLFSLFSKRQEIDLTYNLDENIKLPPEKQVAIYRIVQEALTNIQKHSKADQVKISLTHIGKGQHLLSIEDDGRGFDQEKINNGNGLKNMKVRSHEIGGELIVNTKVNKGTAIKVVFD